MRLIPFWFFFHMTSRVTFLKFNFSSFFVSQNPINLASGTHQKQHPAYLSSFIFCSLPCVHASTTVTPERSNSLSAHAHPWFCTHSLLQECNPHFPAHATPKNSSKLLLCITNLPYHCCIRCSSLAFLQHPGLPSIMILITALLTQWLSPQLDVQKYLFIFSISSI